MKKRMGIIIFACIFIMQTVGAVNATVISEHIVQWDIKNLVTNGWIGQYSDIAIAPNGQTGVVYYDGKESSLKYGIINDKGLLNNVTTIDNTGDVGKYCALVYDNKNNPHVSYHDSTNGDLKYAIKLDLESIWTTSTIDSNLTTGRYTDITIGLNNQPYISYYNYTQRDLMFAYKYNDQWETILVDDKQFTGKYTSIATDMDGNIGISYHNSSKGTLLYAFCQLSSMKWTLEELDSQKVGKFSSLQFNSDSNACISYYDETNKRLKFAYQDKTQKWKTEFVNQNNWAGGYTSLELINDQPYISYYSSHRKDLYYTYKNTAKEWTTRIVDASGRVGKASTIAYNNHDELLYISYYDETNTNLKLVRGSFALDNIYTEPKISHITPILKPTEVNDSELVKTVLSGYKKKKALEKRYALELYVDSKEYKIQALTGELLYAPYTIDSVVMVPLQNIVVFFDSKMYWDGQNGDITIIYNQSETTIKLTDVTPYTTIKPEIKNGIVMVPSTFVEKCFNTTSTYYPFNKALVFKI